MGERKKNQLAGKALLAALEKACRGLFYISETDAEIAPVVAAGTDSKQFAEFIKERASAAGGGPIGSKPAEEFFQRLTQDREWHTEAEKDKVRRFRKLRKVIFENLEEVTMFRIGRIKIEIFVLGYDAKGNIAGITTMSVET